MRAASIRSPSFISQRSGRSTTTFSELPVGQLPLPNDLQEKRAGDFGVLQSFVVNVENPMARRRTSRSTRTRAEDGRLPLHLIDGVLVQSHQVPPFSRYKVRQYVVPAHGFVRITVVTMRSWFEPSAALGLRARRRQRSWAHRLAGLLADPEFSELA